MIYLGRISILRELVRKSSSHHLIRVLVGTDHVSLLLLWTVRTLVIHGNIYCLFVVDILMALCWLLRVLILIIGKCSSTWILLLIKLRLLIHLRIHSWYPQHCRCWWHILLLNVMILWDQVVLQIHQQLMMGIWLNWELLITKHMMALKLHCVVVIFYTKIHLLHLLRNNRILTLP